MYLKLMNDYEEELRLAGKKIKVNDHFARFDFASWLDRQAAQEADVFDSGEDLLFDAALDPDIDGK